MQKKMSGSTLLETMVAMTISLIIFAMVTLLFAQVARRSFSFKQIRAHETLQAYSLTASSLKERTDEKINSGGFELVSHYESIDSLPGIQRGDFSAYDESGLLMDHFSILLQHTPN